MKPVSEYRGENFRVYRERCGRRWQDAAVAISRMLGDDSEWAGFKRRLEGRNHPFSDLVDGARRRVAAENPDSQEYRDDMATLQTAYTGCMPVVCDSGCEHNYKPRPGERKYKPRRIFHCDLSNGDETGSKNPPDCLNVADNACPEFYIDLSKP